MTNKHIELPAQANISTAPAMLNMNDKAMWVIGWNECLAAIAAHEQARVVGEPVAWRYETPTGWHATTDAGKAMSVRSHHPIEPLFASPPAPQEAQADSTPLLPVARIRSWTKHGEGHGDLVDWLEGSENLPDGEYDLYLGPQSEQKPVASIYISPNGEREFDDWKHDLPIGRNELFAAPVAQPASVTTTAHAIHEALNPGAPVEWPLEDEEQPATAQAEAPGWDKATVSRVFSTLRYLLGVKTGDASPQEQLQSIIDTMASWAEAGPVGEMTGHHKVGFGEIPTIKWRDGYWPTVGTLFFTHPPRQDAEQAAKIAELERLCDETYVAQGADAYNHACSEMEAWQKKRKNARKDPGTTGSLCDGMAWLYQRLEELEDAAIDAALASKPPQGEQKAIGTVVLRRRPPGPPNWSEEYAEVELTDGVDLSDGALVYLAPLPEPVAPPAREAPWPTVPDEVMAQIQAYGDARADGKYSELRISDCIFALRRWANHLSATPPAQAVQDSERIRLLTEVETTGEGFRYSLDCLVNNGVNTYRVCDEENNEYFGDDWVRDPVQAIDEAIRAARTRGNGVEPS